LTAGSAGYTLPGVTESTPIGRTAVTDEGGKRGRRLGLASAVALIAMLALASSAQAYIYWDNDGSIARADLDGSPVVPNFISGSDATGVAVDQNFVYWGDATNERIGRANIDGTDPNPNFISGLTNGVCGLAVDSGQIYWGSLAPTPNGTIGRADIDGSDVDESFVTGADFPCGVAVDSSFVYWSNLGTTPFFGTTIGRAELDGDSPDQSFITAGGGGTAPCGVTVNPSSLFFGYRFSNGEGGMTLGRADIDGSDLDSSFVTGTQVITPCGVAVDSEFVYWVNNFDPGSIGRAELDGQQPDPNFITSGVNLAMFVAVDPFPLGTTTSVSCTPTSVAIGQSTTCTATVTDTGGSISPTGTVSFSSPQGSFGSGGSCDLAASAPSQASCSVTYTPSAEGTQTVTATLPTGNNFTGSNGSVPVEAGLRTSATTVLCSPGNVAVSQPTNCTATVSDTTSGGAASSPIGSVGFSGAGGSFASGSCTLSPSGPRQASCGLSFTPRSAGTLQVSGGYTGDATHLGSQSAGQVIATRLIQGVRRNPKKGTAKLIVVAPGPGALTVSGRGINGGGAQAGGPGEFSLSVKATGKTAKRLRRKGRTGVTASVTYTPPGGFSVTESTSVLLTKRR
jgi:virginiamycin B lyase